MNRTSVPAAAFLVALLAMACDSALPSSGSTAPGGETDTPATAIATEAPAASFGPPPSPTAPDDTSPVALEPELLDVLPESIDGIPVQEDLDVASEALLDPTLPAIASGVDAAVAVDMGNGNLVTAWVVRLRPGRFGGEVFRQWRESYDEGACSAADGVVGSAEAEIGGRNTYITTCGEALRTYHVWLEEVDLLVSASAIGDDRFGEKLMEGLRPPE